MNNGLVIHSDKIQRINDEISKINESGFNFNNDESQLYDVERNLKINPDILPISSPTKYSFFSRNKNDGQYKIIREQQISSIFKTVNDLSKNKNPNNQFLSVSIQSNIDNETISEGFSIFWTLSNRIDKDKIKKMSKESEKTNIPNSQNNEKDGSTTLPASLMNPENSPPKQYQTASDENLPIKRKRRSKKEMEFQNHFQNPNFTRSNSQIHPLIQNPNLAQSNSQFLSISQNQNFPTQSLNYMNYGQIRNQPNPILFSSASSAPSIQPIMHISSSPSFLRPNINSNLSTSISTSISSQSIKKSEQHKNQQLSIQPNIFFQQQQQQQQHLSLQTQKNFVNQQRKNQTNSQIKQQEISFYQNHLQQQKNQQNSIQKMSPNLKSPSKTLESKSSNHQPIKQSNINLHPSPSLIKKNSQLQIENLNQQGCIIEIKKIETNEQKEKEKPMNKNDLQKSIMAARDEVLKKGMPPIPTTGVYERQQTAKRHVRRRKRNDFLLDEFDDETNSSNEISEESFFPIIPIKLNQT